MTPTPEQQAIIQAIAETTNHVLVEAGAGCAKTTTAKLASASIRHQALALAFNKRIAEDLAGALPKNFQCKTFNGLGHLAWARKLGAATRLVLDDRKLGKLVSQVSKTWKMKLTTENWETARTLVEKAMGAGLVLSSFLQYEGLTPDTRESWESLAEDQMLSSSELSELVPLAQEVLSQNIQLAFSGTISFLDQVYCPTMLGGNFPKFNFILVDENQDLSSLNILMVQKSLSLSGRIFALGDRRQAIYAWRGANGQAANALRDLRPSEPWLELPLMTTFRCPKAIVIRQQAHVPSFRAAPSASAGTVINWASGPEGAMAWNWTKLKLQAPEEAIAILCRNNAPGMKLAWTLLRQQVGVQVLGRDIGKGLVALVQKLSGKAQDMDILAFLTILTNWEETEKSKAQANDKSHLVSSIVDKVECIRISAESTEAKTVGQLTKLIENLFSRDSGRVIISSIHKAKGLEWPTVVHLDPWRVPSHWAKAQAKLGQRLALEQEYNLRYVAETRTKDTLILANLEDFDRKEPAFDNP